METTTNATPIETTAIETVTPAQVNVSAAFTAYVAHTKDIVAAQAQVSGKAAYAVQGLLMDGKDVTAEQLAVYNAFVAQVQAATDACMAVKGKATACGIFNYLDGRAQGGTGYKVATALGNSISLRTFIANVAILAQRAITATPADGNKGKGNKNKGSVQAATA